MFKRCLIILLLTLGTITFSACWDYRDINKINFPSTGSYDLHKTSAPLTSGQDHLPQLIDLTVIIPNLAEDAKSRYKVETTSGIMVGNARGQKPYSSPGKYSAGVSSVIIMGEDLAGTNINGIMDALFRGAQNPNIVNFAVVEGRGESVMRLPVKDFSNMGDFLKAFLQKSETRGYIPSTTLHNFGVNRATGKNPIMPLLRINNQKVEAAGTAIFQKDRMIGKTNIEETRTLMMLRGIKATGIIPYRIKQDGKLLDKGSVEISNSRKVKVERNADDFTFTITVKLEGTLLDHQYNKLFTDNEDLAKMIEAQIASDIKNDCERFIEKMQEEYKIDCIDISKYALAKWRKELTDIIDEGFIENVNIKVNVQMKLKTMGELT